MAFENLSDKFQSIFKELRSHGRITEDDVRKAMREVRMALLEADVNFKVVKSFVNTVTERAIGQDVMNGLNPGQMVIKIVNEEMVNLMGPTVSELQLRPASDMTVIMLCGLQGAGKTTMAAGCVQKAGTRCLQPATSTVRPRSVSCRSTARNWAFRFLRWVRMRILSTLRRPRSRTRKKTSGTL